MKKIQGVVVAALLAIWTFPAPRAANVQAGPPTRTRWTFPGGKGRPRVPSFG